MFKWDASEGLLLKSVMLPYHETEVFALESKISREDKIEFLDSRLEGKISFLLELADKLEKERESMPKDSWNDIKTVSLKAWIKRNCDIPNLIDTEHYHGKIYLGGSSRNIKSINQKGAYDTYADFVDEMFHKELLKCRDEERRYFREHDEYTILMDEIHDRLNRGNFYTFGLSICYGSKGVFLTPSEESYEPKRRLTLDEMKKLISMNEKVQDFVDELTLKNDIDFDLPQGELPDKKKLKYIER